MGIALLLGLAGGVGGAALGGYVGVKAGSKLEDTLTDEEKVTLEDAFSRLGLTPATHSDKLLPADVLDLLHDSEDTDLDDPVA